MTRPLAPLALALVLTLARVGSQPERCFSRQHQNATVNARAALAGAGVAAASRSAPTEQECVLACCSRQLPPGAKCNMAVFNGNKRNGGEDNCFLYHCPNERDCPLTKAPPGTRTYDIFKGAVHPSTARPVATTTVGGPPVAAATAAPGPSAGTPVLPTATPAAAERADEMPKKQSEPNSHKKTKSEEAGPRTADKVPESTAPPTATPAVGTPPPTSTTPPPTTVTTTPPAATSSPPPPTPTTTTPPPPSTATPPTATAATPPPPRTAIAPTPPPTTKASASASPPPTATTPPPSYLTTPAPLTFGSRRSQTSKVPAGAQNPRGPVSAGPGALKSGVVALLVAAAAALTLALAVGGRKAMESFDRRHYTRLELNDLHYDL